MPLRHQPPALRRAAMSAIAQNFELLCYGVKSRQQMSELLQSEQYLSVSGPLQDLPMGLLEDITEEMKHVTHLRKHHLHMLLTPTITTWRSHGVGDLLVAFPLLVLRCKNLKKLNISYLRHMTPNMLLGLIPCFSSLVSLNLSMTMTADQMLEEIGTHCPFLVELELSGTPVSDRGLVRLCVGSEGERQCQRLGRLVISETSISSYGAVVALQSLPLLTEFDFDNIFEALEILEGWDLALEKRLLSGYGVRMPEEASPYPLQLKLSTLISTSEMVQDSQLDAATRLCPATKTIALANAWLPSEVLYKFMQFEKLQSLSLTNCDGLTLDFEQGVLPLLCVVGHSLRNIILSNFTYIDVLSIGRSCPLLRNLALSNVAEYASIFSPSSECFNNLQALELWSDPQANLEDHLFIQLLKFSPELRNLLFKGCNALTDKLLSSIWQNNQMKELSHLTLDHCHGISVHSLHCLLDTENQLAVIRIWSCEKINKNQNNELMRRICDENMDIYLEWFQYDE